MKRCPFCGGKILDTAEKCRYCGNDLRPKKLNTGPQQKVTIEEPAPRRSFRRRALVASCLLSLVLVGACLITYRMFPDSAKGAGEPLRSIGTAAGSVRLGMSLEEALPLLDKGVRETHLPLTDDSFVDVWRIDGKGYTITFERHAPKPYLVTAIQRQ